MYTLPLCVVLKLPSSKFRLVNDHSAGQFSLNGMIGRADITLRLDGIRDSDTWIHKALEDYNWNLCLFRSDVHGTYRLTLMCPLWQICQVARVEGALHND